MKKTSLFLFVFIASLSSNFSAQAQEFNSGVKQVPLIELYTSEGCSSCPPADRWLSRLKNHEALWSGFVPLALHVDYWDYIGWKDPFASREYSQRQRQYAHEYQESTIYTPGMRKSGEEWRTWRLWGGPTDDKAIDVGELRLNVAASGDFSADFDLKKLDADKNSLQLNVAVLGLGLETDVSRGENRGKTLKHEFVVLGLSRFASADAAMWSGQIPMPATSARRYALAAWVSNKGSVTPLQATGGYLSDAAFAAKLEGG